MLALLWQSDGRCTALHAWRACYPRHIGAQSTYTIPQPQPRARNKKAWCCEMHSCANVLPLWMLVWCPGGLE